jgi:hypothetical protein
MTLTIPITPHADYNALAKAIRSAGTNPQHTLMTVAFRQDDDRSLEFSQSLDDYFGKHLRVIVENSPTTPVDTANRMFKAAVKAFRDSKYPMMYFDPSQRPIMAHWLDVLQANYFRCAAPEVFGKFLSGAPVGSIVLSMKYFQTSTLLNFIPTGIHWRKFLGAEMQRRNEPTAESTLANLIR